MSRPGLFSLEDSGASFELSGHDEHVDPAGDLTPATLLVGSDPHAQHTRHEAGSRVVHVPPGGEPSVPMRPIRRTSRTASLSSSTSSTAVLRTEELGEEESWGSWGMRLLYNGFVHLGLFFYTARGGFRGERPEEKVVSTLRGALWSYERGEAAHQEAYPVQKREAPAAEEHRPRPREGSPEDNPLKVKVNV